MNLTRIRTAGAAVALALAATVPTIGIPSASASSMMMNKNIDFGPACGAVPKSGSGSFAGMTTAPVATAASHNPLLSTLVGAVEKAGLADTLNNAKGVTVFAPYNPAFAKVPAATLKGILANKMELTKLLEYHVLPERLGPGAIGGVHKTIEGGTLKVTGNEKGMYVNGAQVLCGNVQTANADVYIIGSVLVPKS